MRTPCKVTIINPEPHNRKCLIYPQIDVVQYFEIDPDFWSFSDNRENDWFLQGEYL